MVDTAAISGMPRQQLLARTPIGAGLSADLLKLDIVINQTLARTR